MASPAQQTTTTGTTAVQFVAYFVSLSIPPVPYFPLQPFRNPIGKEFLTLAFLTLFFSFKIGLLVNNDSINYNQNKKIIKTGF